MEITEIIKNELKLLKKKTLEQPKPKLTPIYRECAGIPCAYAGVSEDLQEKQYGKPEKKECAAIPCVIHS